MTDYYYRHQIMTALILVLLLFSAVAAAAAAAPSKSWFREKYMKQTYDEYYIYTYSRWSLGDNDVDICPEIHKPAVYFAMTGHNLWRHLPYSYVKYRRQYEQERRQRFNEYFTMPDSHYTQMSNVTVSDVVLFMVDFVSYSWRLIIISLSVLMASTLSFIMVILMFYQY